MKVNKYAAGYVLATAGACIGGFLWWPLWWVAGLMVALVAAGLLFAYFADKQQ